MCRLRAHTILLINIAATFHISTLSLHDALPIYGPLRGTPRHAARFSTTEAFHVGARVVALIYPGQEEIVFISNGTGVLALPWKMPFLH